MYFITTSVKWMSNHNPNDMTNPSCHSSCHCGNCVAKILFDWRRRVEVEAVLPKFLPLTGWSIDSKGYVVYTSRRANVLWRGLRAHKAVWLAHCGWDKSVYWDMVCGLEVHHQDWNKLNNCPANLILLPRVLHATPKYWKQCPYTGRMMSKVEWKRVYGE